MNEFQPETLRWEGFPREDIVQWVMNRHKHQGGFQNQGAIKINDPRERSELEAFGFPEWIAEEFSHIERSKPDEFWSGYWDHLCRPGNTAGWTSGFPHKHGWPHGYTLSMMIQAPVGGGEHGFTHAEDMPPREGVGVIIPGEVEHGVRAVEGNVPRLVLIATVYGPEHVIAMAGG